MIFIPQVLGCACGNNKASPSPQWSLPPQSPRYRGTETPKGENQNINKIMKKETMNKKEYYVQPSMTVIAIENQLMQTFSGDHNSGNNNNPTPTTPIGDAKDNNFFFDEEEEEDN